MLVQSLSTLSHVVHDAFSSGILMFLRHDNLDTHNLQAPKSSALMAAAIGDRIKFLVDTPEKIWGHLDTHEYLEAARRFVQAEQIYRLLQESAASEIRAKFPLVNRQWPSIRNFR